MLRIVIVLFTFGVAAGGSLPIQAQDTLTVMSYNIYHGEQAYDEGKGSVQDIASLINEIQPDYVALQEVDERTGRIAALNDGEPFSLIDSLATLTDMTGHFGKAIDYDGGGYGEGLLSRQPLESQKVMLPNPKGGEKRAVLYVKAHTSTGQAFIFAGTHLGHQFKENRVAQVKAINKYFSAQNLPVMIAGDFNFELSDKAYEVMQRQWMDAAVEFGKQPEPTYSTEEPQKRIDYLFLSNSGSWKVLDVKIIKRNYSDHLPVVGKVVVYPHVVD